MREVIHLAVWFCVMVVPPAIAQHALIGRLQAERTDAPRRRMRVGAWTRADWNPRNYTGQGEKLLVVYGLLSAIQVLLLVAWGAIFIL